MKHGFIKVAAATPDIKVADVEYNTREICRLIDETAAQKSKVTVFPELCITGYTCGDLFAQDLLVKAAKQAIRVIAEHHQGKGWTVFCGSAAFRGRGSLQCGGGCQWRKGSGIYDEDVPAKLWRIL